MSVTYGFYNSLNHDRKYDAVQMSKIFDGIIKDGIFMSIGEYLVVKAGQGMTVNVGPGKAWFNHTWTENDSDYPITDFTSEVVLNRIDAVVLEVDATDSVRTNTIKFVKGSPSSEPVAPTLIETSTVHQHLLCTVNVPAGATEITQSMITNYIGTETTPFVTGILETADLNTLLGQWQAMLDEFVANEKADFDVDYQQMKQDLHDAAAELVAWTDSEEASFLAWFATIKNQLSTDQAGHLQNEIDKESIERILMTGLTDGQKIFSDDGTVITTTDSTGRTLVKTFTNGFLTCTSTLKDAQGGLLGTMVKTFAADGKTIDTEVTII